MADATGGDDAAQATQEAPQEQAQQFDPAMLEQLSSLPDQLEALRGQMEQQAEQWQAAQPEIPEEQAVDLSFVNPESPDYDPERAAAELVRTLQGEQEKAVQDAIKPIQEKLESMQFDRAAEHLENEFPELGDPKVAQEALQTTADWVELAGLPPEAAKNPHVIRTVILMNKAAEAHNQEVNGPQPTQATLEGAAGATPGGTGGGITAQDIIGAQRRSPLPF